MAVLVRAGQAGSLLTRGEAPTFAEFAEPFLSKLASVAAKAIRTKRQPICGGGVNASACFVPKMFAN
jgi:hypothetical protein